MRIEVLLTPREPGPGETEGLVAVVVDVVRATSCIVEAVANGARSVHPAGSVAEARSLAAQFAGAEGGVLLCGERGGARIDGFDLGNSPGDFTRAAVAGRRLAMTTTNGTGAYAALAGAERTLTASFANVSAVAEELRFARRVAIVCAGKEGRFGLDDALCAGRIVATAAGEAGAAAELNDGALAARDLATRHPVSAELLAGTAAGRALVGIGLGGDLALCAETDRHKIVPVMKNGQIVAPTR